MTGSIGEVAIAPKNWIYPVNSNQAIAKVVANNKINPYFLYVFLMCRFGKNQLIREARGSVQLNIFPSQIENLKIPLFSLEFEKQIQTTAEQIDDLFCQAEESYNQAQSLLLSELGLNYNTIQQ